MVDFIGEKANNNTTESSWKRIMKKSKDKLGSILPEHIKLRDREA
jgi:hypothetical protein